MDTLETPVAFVIAHSEQLYIDCRKWIDYNITVLCYVMLCYVCVLGISWSCGKLYTFL